MKKFIVKIVVAAILVVGLLVFLDYFVSKGLKHKEDFRFQVWTDITDGNIDADLIFMGNSRAAMHLDCAVFDSILHCNSYNLGMEAYSFDVQWLRLKTYLEYCAIPKVVICNMDYSTFGTSVFSANKEQILPYFDNPYLRTQLTKYGFTDVDLYMPFYRYIGFTQETYWGLIEGLEIKDFPGSKAYKGYTPRPKLGFSNDRMGMGTVACISEQSLNDFREMVTWCKKNDVQLILVGMPFYDYANMKKSVGGYDIYQRTVDNLINEYDLPLLDYSSDMRYQNRDYYNDPSHMHADAARLFSIELACDLESLGVFRKRE